MSQDDGQVVGEVTADPLARVLDRLEGVKPRPGGKWQARCPAHDDKHPSLSISRGQDGRVLLHCQVGCALETICGKMGLKVADLHRREKRARKGNAKEIVAAYDYVDENGVLLSQVVRYRPKTFKQRRPHPSGGWAWGVTPGWYRRGGRDWYQVKEGGEVPRGAVQLPGCRRVLYRLPELVDADPSAWVFIVEGEKDADRLAALGLTATTNPGGAGKWRDEYAETLRGRKVAVIPDNDATGIEHAEQVARSLAGVGADVRIVRLPDVPDAGDVSDWLDDQGGTVETLMGLVNDAPAHVAVACAPTQDNQVIQSPDVSGCDQVVEGSLNVKEGEPLAEFIERACSTLRGCRSPVFHFARAVKGHPSMRDMTAGAAVRQVQLILDTQARPSGADRWREALGIDAARAVADFQRAWHDAYSTPGEPLLDRMIDQAKADPIPFVTDYEGREYLAFLTAVARLQASRGESSPVRVCTRQFGDALGVHFTTVAAYCEFAVRDGYMKLVKKAVVRPADGKCAEYRFDLDRLPRENSPPSGPQAA